MKPNVILGISDNYNYFHLARFFESLFKTSYTGKVVLFAGPNTGPHTLRKLRSLNVEVIQYESQFPYVPQPHKDNFKELPNPIHIYNFRHFLYYDYLLKHEEEFGNVLLTDTRDVVFQKDPFDFVIADALHVAMESKEKIIGDCHYNSNWVRSGYGQAKLDELANQVVSCAGTTIGPMLHVKRYLRTLLTDIIGLHNAYDCADQAVHNKLLYAGAIHPVRQLFNDNTPILTVGTEFLFQHDREGYLLDGRGKRVNIVHQYDRHPGLLKIIDDQVFPGKLRKNYLKFRYKFLP